MTDATFCLNLRKQMLRASVTQSMLAKRVGVSRACAHRWYWGISEPNIGALRKIGEALGCTLDDLIGG